MHAEKDQNRKRAKIKIRSHAKKITFRQARSLTVLGHNYARAGFLSE
jgi:hypothetical protein